MTDKLAYAFTDIKPTPGRGTARDNFIEGAAIIKAITGGDDVDIEVKNVARGFSVRLPCAIWVASNFAPKWVDGVEDAVAWRRRMCPVVFEQSVPDEAKIPDLAEKMFGAEGPHIAMTCIQAFADGVARTGWPQLTERALRHLASWIDSAKGEQVLYVESFIVHTGNVEDKIPNKDLFSEYANYAGIAEDSSGRSAITKALTNAVPDHFWD